MSAMTRWGSHSGFEGVLKIIRFNTRFYLGSAFGFVGVLLLLYLNLLPEWLRVGALFGAIVTAFWTLSSIFVSWYVYDYVGVTRLEWMPGRLRLVPKRWANIHAGLDDSTTFLRRLFPSAEAIVVDIY
jgi:hypothetical protein